MASSSKVLGLYRKMTVAKNAQPNALRQAETLVHAWRPGRIYPAKAPCRENSWLITGWKGCDRQEWSTSPTRADFAARIVSVGLIGVLPTAADLDGGLAQKSKRLSDRLKLGSRPKEFPNCNALP